MKQKLVLLLATGLCAINLHGQNLILNGSFESGAWSENSFLTGGMNLGNGSTVIDHWVAGTGGGNLWWFKTPNWNAQNGTFFVDLDSNTFTSKSFIQQTFATTIGTQYKVSAYFAGDDNMGSSASVMINNRLIGTATIDPQPGAPTPMNVLVWVPWSFTFTADSTSSTLKFQDATVNSDNNPSVDNVSVTVVPEPSMLGFGFAAALAFLLRRARQTLVHRP